MSMLKCEIPYNKQPRRSYFQYSEGDYECMREKTSDFAEDNYFNGYQNSRAVEENWQLIKEFLLKCINIHVPRNISKGVQSLPWITREITKLVTRRNRTHAKF